MRFDEAVKYLCNGDTIELDDWLYTLKDIKDDERLIITYDQFISDKWIVHIKPDKTFIDVYDAFMQGKFIRRKAFVGKKSNLHKDYGHLSLSVDDIFANDWEIIND